MRSSVDPILYQVAQMYYIDNYSQIEIAQALNLSRPKVSRLLAKARNEGVVQINLAPPLASGETGHVETLLKETLHLKNILVVPSVSSDESENLRTTAAAAAEYFSQFIQDGDNIGVSWGYTLLEISKHLPAKALSNSSIVQICGNLDNADSTNYANEIIRLFCEKMQIHQKSTLPCPVMVENSIIVDLLLHDSKISSIMKEINSVDVAFLNIGVLNENNCLYCTGFLHPEDLTYLQNKQAVGCVCSRFIDASGEIVDDTYDSRTISIGLSALKKARISCACIASERKIPPLMGAVRSGLVNTIAIDGNTAEQLLLYAGKES